MFLRGSSAKPSSLIGKFAGYPLETAVKSDRDEVVSKYADYLAKTSGTRAFPWRLMVVVDNDAKPGRVDDGLQSLAAPNRIQDPSWIKPGKVAWDWWNDWNIYGVDFKSGVDTQTYKYYIDFASKYGLPYIILDEGWYHLEDVLKVKSEVDIEEPGSLRQVEECRPHPLGYMEGAKRCSMKRLPSSRSGALRV